MRPNRTTRRLAGLAVAALTGLSACGGSDGSAAAPDASTAGTGSTSAPTTDATEGTDTGALDSTVVHQISVEVDEVALADMIETYDATGDKDWISATVTIDGTTYEQAGIRLKGNSSLRDVSTDSAPETLPWLIKLDEFVEDQSHDGIEEVVIRSNSSTTALNEAVALDLLERAGLASQDAMATGFAVNGSDPVLRLAIESPDGEWVEHWFGTDGSLYKAESTGDYRYRGDDPAAYDEVFDLEAGDDDQLAHLTAFLQFVNESDDATFAAELGERLDVDAFAGYLAMMELLGNFDDIDGPGNNSYLYYDPDTDQMTVVPWDMNLALGVGMGGGGAAGGGAMGPPDGERGAPPAGGGPGGAAGEVAGGPGGGGGPAGGGAPGGPGTRTNVLVERFLADEQFAALYDDALSTLRVELFDSGVADELLAGWVDVLESGATGLVDTETVDSEAARVADAFPS